MYGKMIKRIAKKVGKKAEKEKQKETNSVIKKLKADIKKAAKDGDLIFRVKIEDTKIYKKVEMYFKSKGLKCSEYMCGNSKYLLIEW